MKGRRKKGRGREEREREREREREEREREREGERERGGKDNHYIVLIPYCDGSLANNSFYRS